MDPLKPKYYLVEASALPEVFVKVTEAKSLLETGEARTVAEAVAQRSSGIRKPARQPKESANPPLYICPLHHFLS